jgi:hypothetical protein
MSYLKDMSVIKLLSDVRNKDINKIKISSNNSILHEITKTTIGHILLANSKRFVVEGVFKSGGRADVIDLTDGCAFEIVKSETEESIASKSIKYPIDIFTVDLKGITSETTLAQYYTKIRDDVSVCGFC